MTWLALLWFGCGLFSIFKLCALIDQLQEIDPLEDHEVLISCICCMILGPTLPLAVYLHGWWTTRSFK